MSGDIFQDIDKLSDDDLLRLEQSIQEAKAGKRTKKINEIKELIRDSDAKPSELFSRVELEAAFAGVVKAAPSRPRAQKGQGLKKPIYLPDDFSAKLYRIPGSNGKVFWWEGKATKGSEDAKSAVQAVADWETSLLVNDEEKHQLYADNKPESLPQE